MFETIVPIPCKLYLKDNLNTLKIVTFLYLVYLGWKKISFTNESL